MVTLPVGSGLGFSGNLIKENHFEGGLVLTLSTSQTLFHDPATMLSLSSWGLVLDSEREEVYRVRGRDKSVSKSEVD